mmetsp:Transcript_33301/g.75909  ORF Transcript_33301/g.75909 Transcript_33301/m.75909 type:complete len:645 (-) Transcript_33301:63-1997(-)
MKFGKNIGQQQQDDTFGLHYVDYKLLKKKIKSIAEHLQKQELSDALTANTHFDDVLGAEIREVNTSFERRVQELLDIISSLSEQLQHISASRGKSSSSSSTSYHDDEASNRHPAWHGLFENLINLLKEVDVLRKYAVWNAVGVVKILKKRRKQTGLGLGDVGAERAGWLSRQRFFSGSDFAELHATLESFGLELVSIFSEIVPSMSHSTPEEPVQCPICLDTITDKIELPCQHRFCWKCFVLGPIAHQPQDEYRFLHCPICRCEAVKQPPNTLALPPAAAEDEDFENLGGLVSSSPGVLTRFLHTYFPKGVAPEVDGTAGDDSDKTEDDMREVITNLVKVMLESNREKKADSGPTQQSPHAASAASDAVGPALPTDFFDTLPPKQPAQQLREAQKVQWLQQTLCDPFELDGNMSCSLCCEPLCMEAVVTTPCKHHFHKVCVQRIEVPQCPLCSMSLPFSWFLPRGHPLSDSGFRCVPVCKYKPHFPGGPGRGNNGFPLHAPPPASLHSAAGMIKSYIHKIPPMGDEEEEDLAELQSPTSHPTPTLLGQASPAGDIPASELPQAAASDSESSSEESDDGEGAAAEGAGMRPADTKKSHRGAQLSWAYTALGKMRLCTGKSASSGSAMHADASLRNQHVLLIGNHV